MKTIIGQVILGLLILAVAGMFLFNFDPFGRRKAAEQRAVTATTQEESTKGAAEAAESYHNSVTVIRDQTEREYNAIQALPGADQPLDPERRAALCAALSRLRDGAQACDPLGSPEPAPAMR